MAGPPLPATTRAPAASGLGIAPLVFNGIVTFDWPQVGLLLDQASPGAPWLLRCTATLIGPSAALTAAHCVCDSSGSLCQPGRRDAPDPDRLRLLLQNGGLLEIEHIALPSGFRFPDQDYAVLDLREQVDGIAPLPLATGIPPSGTAGEIVGFGSDSGGVSALGVKRSGHVRTLACGPQLSDADFVCWESAPGMEGSNTCLGDSGAPLIVAGDSGSPVLAGLASGGYGSCDWEDLAFDTALAPVSESIAGMASEPLSPIPDGESIMQAAIAQSMLGGTAPALTLTIEVPADAARLTVVGNGDDGGGNGHALRLRRGSPPGAADDDCVSDRPGVFESCEVRNPLPGIWYAEYRRTVGLGGQVQLSATVYGVRCTLDLDGDGHLDALTDGLLALRHLSGRTGTGLTQGVLGPEARRTAAAEIAAMLDSHACAQDLDLDGNGMMDASTDGLLLLRYLLGFRGDALVNGAVGEGALRRTPDEIGSWIEGLIQ